MPFGLVGNMCARDLTVHKIKETYKFLSQTDDLSPNNDGVNACLTDFVSSLCDLQDSADADIILQLDEIAAELDALPDLCGQAECEMEKFWAKKLINDPDIKNDGIKKFWYFEHYKNLCMAENDLANIGHFENISFLGCGALPLTAYFASIHSPDAKIKCIDFDCTACGLAWDLMKALDLTDRIEIINDKAVDYKPAKNELVICASLLSGRLDMYKQLVRNGVKTMMVRDAEGMYQFLYKPAEKPDLPFVEIGKTTPTRERINTTLLYTAHEG
jgi:hypothetical protein